jgi:formylglycine-generating enzyme
MRKNAMSLRALGLCAAMALAGLVVPQAQAQTRAAGQVFSDCPDCPPMVVIPTGTFLRGSSDDERSREGVPKMFADRETLRAEVTISKPFALGKFEVTRGQYARFVADTRRPDPPTCGLHDPKTDTWPQQAGYSWRNTGFYQSDDHPVGCISWTDARDYAAWLAKKTGKPYRLATEAEWEHAARAGTTTTRYWGDAFEPACQVQANVMTAETIRRMGSPASWSNKIVCSTPVAFTVAVGSYPPNPFGLHDMIGNIHEWVADCFNPTYAGSPTDGSAWQSADCPQRMVRGGGYHSANWLARSAFRGGPVPPEMRPVASGIRVARDLP